LQVQALFPDNAYGVDSGGPPTVIPNLTFQQFQVCFLFLCGWTSKYMFQAIVGAALGKFKMLEYQCCLWWFFFWLEAWYIFLHMKLFCVCEGKSYCPILSSPLCSWQEVRAKFYHPSNDLVIMHNDYWVITRLKG